jgi:hypothetical protein
MAVPPFQQPTPYSVLHHLLQETDTLVPYREAHPPSPTLPQTGMDPFELMVQASLRDDAQYIVKRRAGWLQANGTDSKLS